MGERAEPPPPNTPYEEGRLRALRGGFWFVVALADDGDDPPDNGVCAAFLPYDLPGRITSRSRVIFISTRSRGNNRRVFWLFYDPSPQGARPGDECFFRVGVSGPRQYRLDWVYVTRMAIHPCRGGRGRPTGEAGGR